MFHFRIIQIGETKDRNLASLIEVYKKRIGGRAKIEILTIKEPSHSEVRNAAQKLLIKEKEADKILEKIGEGTFVVALDERGREFTSTDFAGFLGREMDRGIGRFTFIIGGCFGLSERIPLKAQITLSLSQFTFTHELSRLVLMEQLYRALSIIEGREYHY